MNQLSIFDKTNLQTTTTTTATFKVNPKLPRFLPKSKLRAIFGNCSWHCLHTKLITRAFIADTLQMDYSDYRRIKVFTFEQTQLIYQYFQIDEQDLIE